MNVKELLNKLSNSHIRGGKIYYESNGILSEFYALKDNKSVHIKNEIDQYTENINLRDLLYFYCSIFFVQHSKVVSSNFWLIDNLSKERRDSLLKIIIEDDSTAFFKKICSKKLSWKYDIEGKNINIFIIKRLITFSGNTSVIKKLYDLIKEEKIVLSDLISVSNLKSIRADKVELLNNDHLNLLNEWHQESYEKDFLKGFFKYEGSFKNISLMELILINGFIKNSEFKSSIAKIEQIFINQMTEKFLNKIYSEDALTLLIKYLENKYNRSEKEEKKFFWENLLVLVRNKKFNEFVKEKQEEKKKIKKI